MASITAALVATGVLGLWFTATRQMAVCSLALLCAFRPWLAAIVIFGVSLAFYLFKIHQR